jgi:signal transduction histidine kinase
VSGARQRVTGIDLTLQILYQNNGDFTGPANGLVVTDDGEPLSAGEVEGAFTYGEAVPDSESGMLLPVVRTLAEAHGWESSIDTDYREGVRVVLSW